MASEVVSKVINQIGVLEMRWGKANALDPQFLCRLQEALETFKANPQVHAVTMVSSLPTIFSCGVNLRAYLSPSTTENFVDELLQGLDSLLFSMISLPKPLIAAVNGHALAGGCVLAAACDYRVMTNQPTAQIGVTELLVGVPFPHLPLHVMTSLLSPSISMNLIYTGRSLSPMDAKSVGLVDEIVPQNIVASRGIEVASKMALVDPRVFAMTKLSLRENLIQKHSTGWKDHQPTADAIRAVWKCPTTRSRIEKFIQANVGAEKSKI